MQTSLFQAKQLSYQYFYKITEIKLINYETSTTNYKVSEQISDI